jgi:ribonucleoside-diphosphate reductase beta chain
MLLAIQSYQELIHSKSYATILESIVPAEDRNAVYYFWRDDKILLDRNEYI